MARERAGTDESVFTGRGLVYGRPVAVVADEFRFLAGSIGLAGRAASPVRFAARPPRGCRARHDGQRRYPDAGG